MPDNLTNLGTRRGDTSDARQVLETAVMSDLRKLVHGRPLTPEELEDHEECGESSHIPAIVHRSGGASAQRLNACGICGAQIVPNDDGQWLAVTEAQADEIRAKARGER